MFNDMEKGEMMIYSDVVDDTLSLYTEWTRVSRVMLLSVLDQIHCGRLIQWAVVYGFGVKQQ